MAQSDDGSMAPRRSLSGPILPPPPPEMAESSRRAEAERTRHEQVTRERAEQQQAAQQRADQDKAAQEQAAQQRADAEQRASRGSEQGGTQTSASASAPRKGATTRAPSKTGPARARRAQLRLVQVDAWSVMKTSFLLSIAIGIVLIVAVAIIWTVLGAAGVWDSINSIVQQAVGGESGKPFDIKDYASTSRVLGLTMVVAVIDVILITAIATLSAFLYNLSAALLGGVEVTLAEDG